MYFKSFCCIRGKDAVYYICLRILSDLTKKRRDEHGEYENNAGFEPVSEGKYVLPLTYIEDQSTFVGILGRDPVLLDYDSMTFDWETEEYKWL